MDQEVQNRLHANRKQIHAALLSTTVKIGYLVAAANPRSGERGIAKYRPDLRAASGFLVIINGAPCVCTAGHVITNLGEPRKGLKVVRPHIGFLQASDEPVTIDLKLREIRLGRALAENGMDAGLIPLSDTQYETLRSAGARFIGGDKWRPPNFDPHLFVALGYPKDNSKTTPTVGEHTIEFNAVYRTPMLLLEALRDDYAGTNKIPRFRGKLLSRQGDCNGEVELVMSTNGMSGGPIFALRLEQDRFISSLLAIQTVERDDGTIGGCYFNHLLRTLRGEAIVS